MTLETSGLKPEADNCHRSAVVQSPGHTSSRGATTDVCRPVAERSPVRAPYDGLPNPSKWTPNA
ncbi:hypothetical protein RISK_001403 [Rhodopirellula islandica]|uniref:Uncharacterized protein n=1 Tax=Rhodopirellula islandica TaxID=595434 RepID=A0A0J1BJQ0_RHOIS|nr:hypothetical protein RISK_001403 [Rhodopirellula islandica]